MDRVKQDFHSLNNWLNKITILSAVTRHQLETSGFNLESMEEEKKRFIKLLNDMEEYALNIGEILKNLKKTVEAPKGALPDRGQIKR